MADEFNSTGTWWDSARPTTNTAARFDVVGSSSSSSALRSFGWPSEMVSDVKPRTSIDSVSVSGSSVHDSSTDLHMMGLGLSSQPIDWNQTLLSRTDHNKGAGESGFRSMLQDSMSPSSSYATQESAWRAAENAVPESPVTASSFHIDSAAALYGNPSTLLQGILGSSDNHHQSPAPSSNRGLNFQQFANYGSVINPSELMQPASSWNSSNSSGNNSKVPPFLRGSPPKQMLFSNNAPFWNPAATAVSADVRPSFFSSPLQQPQFPASAPSFDEKPKNISEAGDSASSVGKKSGSDAAASKRPRNETTSSTLPAFKVRKEKMGDRITALQQLVSPFGKTDTASVLSEAIEYIKFLHDQVNVLSTPYMKSGASIQQQQQQNLDKTNESDNHQGPKQDLRSRGLCLVPVSSTFPVTHETTVDYWTPTFGGTFR